jgi:hypothetical protein
MKKLLQELFRRMGSPTLALGFTAFNPGGNSLKPLLQQIFNNL